MLPLPERSMMADETNGPMKDEVFCGLAGKQGEMGATYADDGEEGKEEELRVRDEGWRELTSLPRGTTSEIIACCFCQAWYVSRVGGQTHRDSVPGAHKDLLSAPPLQRSHAIVCLVRL